MIMWGTVAGGIFFREFDTLHEGMWGAGNWVMFILALMLIFVGLYLVRPDSPPTTPGGDELEATPQQTASPKSVPANEEGDGVTASVVATSGEADGATPVAAPVSSNGWTAE